MNIKKSLIALALLASLNVSAQAAEPETKSLFNRVTISTVDISYADFDESYSGMAYGFNKTLTDNLYVGLSFLSIDDGGEDLTYSIGYKNTIKTGFDFYVQTGITNSEAESGYEYDSNSFSIGVATFEGNLASHVGFTHVIPDIEDADAYTTLDASIHFVSDGGVSLGLETSIGKINDQTVTQLGLTLGYLF